MYPSANMPRGAGEIYSLAKQYAELGKKGAYIIADKFIADKYHDEVISSFEKSGTPYKLVVFGGECSRAEIEKHCHNLGDADVIISQGGGKTLDTSKAVAFYTGKRMIIMSTAASNDAPLQPPLGGLQGNRGV